MYDKKEIESGMKMGLLEETIRAVRPLDESAMKTASVRWDSIAKPLHSLGQLEQQIITIAGIMGDPDVVVSPRAIVEMCADNGVVEEGVSQTGQEVTAIVAENFLSGDTTSCVMGKCCQADIIPVDIGMAVDTKVRRDKKIRYGTANMAKEPAMSRQEAVKAIEAGISMAFECRERGYRILATGEMGIGNTTSSSAMASVLLKLPVEAVTGRGAGLSHDGLSRKIQAIKRAIETNHPDPHDAIDTLAKVGGLDIAGMAGLYLGGAACRIPVVMDGFISCVAALTASLVCPLTVDYMLPSHVSGEHAARKILEYLGKKAPIHADLCLGEGTGAAALFPLLDMAAAVYRSMSTFTDIKVEQYKELL